MEEINFDPFRDRQARDIRNSLSAAFTRSVEELTPTAFESTGQSLLQTKLPDAKKSYILDHLERYRKCLAIFIRQPETTLLQKSLILWDNELFFEVHEILEKLWMEAQGREKIALQGLIRAAGVYILMRGGSRKGMEKMAAKAVKALEENLDVFPDFPSPHRLLAKLKALDPHPPKLRQ